MQVSEEEISKLKKLDKGTQKLVFIKLYPLLVKVCILYSPDQMMAEDAATTAFIKAFKGIDQFQYSHENSFYAWLRIVAIRELIGEIRRKREFVTLDLLTETIEEPVVQQIHELDIHKIHEFLNQLNITQKAVFLLFALEGYNHAEISEMLKISESNSKQIYHRAKKKIQQLIISSEGSQYGKLGK